MYSPKFAVSILFEFFLPLLIVCSHATSCTLCTKTKAACKPFDTEKAQAKAKAETVRRSTARKVKQQTDTEWKVEISRKLEDLSELSRLRKDIQRIAVALEKLAGIGGQNSDEELLSWLEEEKEKMEIQGSKNKEKQKEERINRAEEEEEVGGQKEENRMEGVEKRSNNSSPVAYSVSTGAF